MDFMTLFTRWRSHRQARQELSFLEPNEVGVLARDAGLSTEQLARLAARGINGSEELPQLLHAAGLEPERMRRTRPDVVRDMVIVCSGCEVARRCRHDLARGRAATVRRYCPNDETIKALQAEKCRAVS